MVGQRLVERRLLLERPQLLAELGHAHEGLLRGLHVPLPGSPPARPPPLQAFWAAVTRAFEHVGLVAPGGRRLEAGPALARGQREEPAAQPRRAARAASRCRAWSSSIRARAASRRAVGGGDRGVELGAFLLELPRFASRSARAVRAASSFWSSAWIRVTRPAASAVSAPGKPDRPSSATSASRARGPPSPAPRAGPTSRPSASAVDRSCSGPQALASAGARRRLAPPPRPRGSGESAASRPGAIARGHGLTACAHTGQGSPAWRPRRRARAACCPVRRLPLGPRRVSRSRASRLGLLGPRQRGFRRGEGGLGVGVGLPLVRDGPGRRLDPRRESEGAARRAASPRRASCGAPRRSRATPSAAAGARAPRRPPRGPRRRHRAWPGRCRSPSRSLASSRPAASTSRRSARASWARARALGEGREGGLGLPGAAPRPRSARPDARASASGVASA